MALIDTASAIVTKNELELFATKPTQTAIESGRIISVNPTTALANSDFIEFSIVTGNHEYIDLRETTLYIKTKITKSDGTALAEGGGAPARVYPVNYPIGSFFRQVEVQLGGKTIGTSSNLYGYRALFQVLLNHCPDAKQHQLRAGGFYMDHSNMEETGAAIVNATSTNKGANSRFKLSKYSRSFELEGSIHHEIFEQNKLLLSGIPLTIKLTPADANFCLMSASDATSYKIEFQKALLKASIKRIAPYVHKAITTRMETSNCKYPILRREMRQFQPAAHNTRSISEPNLCQGQLPRRIVLALVENQARNGALTRNPFNFKHFNVTSLKLSVNGEQLPYGELTMDFANKNVVEAYMTLFRGCKLWPGNVSNGITMADFIDGHTIYVFNLAPDDAGSSVFQLAKTGPVSLDMTTSEDIDPAVSIIALFEYDSFFEIDDHRNIHWRQGIPAAV